MVIGGVVKDHLLADCDDVLKCIPSGMSLEIKTRYHCSNPGDSFTTKVPLYVGTSTVPLPDGRVVILGGGATCFSMGTYWNKGIFTLEFEKPWGQAAAALPESVGKWTYEKSVEIIPGEKSIPIVAKSEPKQDVEGKATSPPSRTKSIPRIKLQNSEDFAKVVRDGRPVVIEGLELGSCRSTWSLEGLAEKVGKDQKVPFCEPKSSAPQVADSRSHLTGRHS